ncbi:MAG: GntR family transcriptional regulator [Chloroflexota bacterium]|nr:GntR family transcriptional regulator [Chloroflexota bacterium]
MSELTGIKGIPLYVQIRETIREQIKSGQVSIGEKLPSEEEIAGQFSVSRMTARRALDDLVQEGLVMRRQGVGTLVASRRITRNYTRLTSFYEQAAEEGLNPSSKLLDLVVIPASADLASHLMIKPDAPVMRITRLRMLDGDPISLHVAHVARSLCPALMDEDLANQSLYRLYDAYGLEIAWAKQCIEARAADESLAHHLGLEQGAPLLYSERTTYTVNNTPIEWVYGYASSAPYAIEFTLFRKESAPNPTT